MEPSEKKCRRRSIRNLRRSSTTFGIPGRLAEGEIDLVGDNAEKPLSSLVSAYGSAWVDEKSLIRDNSQLNTQASHLAQTQSIQDHAQWNEEEQQCFTGLKIREVDKEHEDSSDPPTEIYSSEEKSSLRCVLESESIEYQSMIGVQMSPIANRASDSDVLELNCPVTNTNMEGNITDIPHDQSKDLTQSRKSDSVHHAWDPDGDNSIDQLNQALVSTPHPSPSMELTEGNDHSTSPEIPRDLTSIQSSEISFAGPSVTNSNIKSPVVVRTKSTHKSLKSAYKRGIPEEKSMSFAQTQPRPVHRKASPVEKHVAFTCKQKSGPSYMHAKSMNKCATSSLKSETTNKHSTPTHKHMQSSAHELSASGRKPNKCRTSSGTKLATSITKQPTSMPKLSSPASCGQSSSSATSDKDLIQNFQMLADKLQSLRHDSSTKAKYKASSGDPVGKEKPRTTRRSVTGSVKKSKCSVAVPNEPCREVDRNSYLSKTKSSVVIKKRSSVTPVSKQTSQDQVASTCAKKSSTARKLSITDDVCHDRSMTPSKNLTNAGVLRKKKRMSAETQLDVAGDNIHNIIHRLSCKFQALKAQAETSSNCRRSLSDKDISQTGTASCDSGDVEAIGTSDSVDGSKRTDLKPDSVKDVHNTDKQIIGEISYCPTSLEKEQTFDISDLQSHSVGMDNNFEKGGGDWQNGHKNDGLDTCWEAHKGAAEMNHSSLISFHDTKNSITHNETASSNKPKKKRLSLKKLPTGSDSCQIKSEESDTGDKHSGENVKHSNANTKCKSLVQHELLGTKTDSETFTDCILKEQSDPKLAMLYPDSQSGNEQSNQDVNCVRSPDFSEEMLQGLLNGEFLDLPFSDVSALSGKKRKATAERRARSQRRSSRYFSMQEMPLCPQQTSKGGNSFATLDSQVTNLSLLENGVVVNSVQGRGQDNESKENIPDILTPKKDSKRDSLITDQEAMESVLVDLVNLRVSDVNNTEYRAGEWRRKSSPLKLSSADHCTDFSPYGTDGHRISRDSDSMSQIYDSSRNPVFDSCEAMISCHDQDESVARVDSDRIREMNVRETETVEIEEGEIVSSNLEGQEIADSGQLDVRPAQDGLIDLHTESDESILPEDSANLAGQRCLRVRKSRKSWDLTQSSDNVSKGRKTRHQNEGKEVQEKSPHDVCALSSATCVNPALENLYRNKNYVLPHPRAWETIRENPTTKQTIFTKTRYKRFLQFEDRVSQAKLLRRHKKAQTCKAGTRKRSQISDAEFEQKMLDVQLFLDSPSTFSTTKENA